MQADKATVTRLLKTARGQLEAVLKMIDDDRYCIDISNQILATEALLKKPTAKSCAAIWNTASKTRSSPATAKKKRIDELMSILEKMNK